MFSDYQQAGSNLLYLTFINPALMPDVPPAMAALAKSRGTNTPGAVPKTTSILFSIGGEAYSSKPNPWRRHWRWPRLARFWMWAARLRCRS